MKENETIEFKKTTNKLNDAMISIASILNKHKKGFLYIGLKNDGTPFEFNITDSTLRDVSRKIYESIKPQIYPVIEVIKIKGINVIKVSFSGDDVPYSAFGKYYMRTFDEDRELTPNELRKIMISREYEEKFEEKDSKEGLNDVDEKTLEKFYYSAKDSGRLPDVPFDKVKLLTSLGLLNNKKLNNAGRLLFSKNKPIKLKTIVFATHERLTILDLKKSKGNIFDLIDESMKFIIKNIRRRVESQGLTLERKEVPEVPLDALREAIVNSFAHARYDLNIEHEIDIYSNRISITNPGSFANEFDPIDFYKKDLKSYLRNEKIADLLYMRKDIETAGYGLKKIYSLCKKENVKVSYIKNENDFTLEFSRNDRNLSYNYKKNKNKNEDEQFILDLLKDNPHYFKKDILDSTNMSSRTIDRIIASLKEKKLLTRVGSNKNGYWKVN